MTIDQQNYINSFHKWAESLQISIDMGNATIDNSQRMILHHSKTIQIENELLNFNKIQLDECILNFNKWCDNEELKDHKING